MTAKLYVASYNVPLAGGEEHSYLFYDPDTDNNNDPTNGLGMQIIRGGRPANHGITGVPNNIVIEVQPTAAESVDGFKPVDTVTSLHFSSLLTGTSATSSWNKISMFAPTMGTRDYVDQDLYNTGINYDALGPNSNSVTNTLLSIVGLDFRFNTPFNDNSTTTFKDPYLFPGHMALIDGSGNATYNAYKVLNPTGAFDSSFDFYKANGIDKILLERGSELYVRNVQAADGLTTLVLTGEKFIDTRFQEFVVGDIGYTSDTDVSILGYKNNNGINNTEFVFDDVTVRRGTSGNDTMAAYADRASSIYGMEGNDVLRGSFYNDYFNPGTGVDAVYGGTVAYSDHDVLDLSNFTSSVTLNLLGGTYSSGSSSGTFQQIEEFRLGNTNDTITFTGGVSPNRDHEIVDAGGGTDILQTRTGTVRSDAIFVDGVEIRGIENIQINNSVGGYSEIASFTVIDMGRTYTGVVANSYGTFNYSNYQHALNFNISSGNGTVTDGTYTDTFTGLRTWQGVGSNFGDTISLRSLPTDNNVFLATGSGNDTITIDGGSVLYSGGNDTINFSYLSPSGQAEFLYLEFSQPASSVTKAQSISSQSTSGGILTQNLTFNYSVNGLGTIAVTGLKRQYTAGSDGVLGTSDDVISSDPTYLLSERYNKTPVPPSYGSDTYASAPSYNAGFGNDIILSGGGSGGFGNDTINGSNGNDNLYGQGGDDILDGKGGVDNYYGGAGNDTLNASSEFGTYNGGDGYDLLDFKNLTNSVKLNYNSLWSSSYGSSSFATMYGIELISGTSANDVLTYGYNAKNYTRVSLDGVGGTDVVKLYFTAADLTASMQEALSAYKSYIVAGAAGWYSLAPLNIELRSFETLEVYRDNVLYTLPTQSIVLGNSSNNSLTGTSGNDVIQGLLGDDLLTGLAGNDNYIYDGGIDTIVDSGGVETISLNGNYALSAVTAARSVNGNDLELSLNGIKSIIVKNHFVSTNSTVEKIRSGVFGDTDLASLVPAPTLPGLVASHYILSSGVQNLSQINFAVPPSRVEVVTSVNKAGSDPFYTNGPTDNFAVSYAGYLHVVTAGSYTISLNSDDGSELWIDGIKVINNDGLHGSQSISYTQTLSAGDHALKLNYFEAGGGQVVQLSWNGPDTNSQTVVISGAGLAYNESQLANSIPVATDDTAATVKNIPVTISVLGNDTDLNGDTLSISALTQGAHGTAVLNSNGTITYTPATNYVGSDAFTYTVSDGHGGTDVANVNVTIGAALSGGLIASYHNANVSSLSQVNYGATPIYTEIVNSINKNGSASTPFYTNGPIDNFAVSYNGYLHINTAGTYTFSLNSDDGSELWLDGTKVINNDGLHGAQIVSSTLTLTAGDHALKLNYFESTGDQTVQLFWNGPDSNGQTSIISGADLLNPTPNTPPTVVNDAASINKDVATVLNVLRNDTDLNGDALTVSAVTQGAHGTVTINANRTVTYTPAAGYTGSDTFTYTTNDGHSGTNVGTVTLTIAAGTILGTSANNTLTGGAEANHIYGYAGNDTLTGGAGFDVLYGGANDDSYVFAPGFGGAAVLGPDQIYENINEGNDWINMPTVNGGGFRMWVDENQDLHIRLVGSVTDEILVLGETAAGGGTDVISRIEGVNYNGGWIPTYYELNLGDTDDSHTMHGAATNDILNGFGGDDIIYGFGGNDLLIGDQGADELHGGVGNDTVRGGFGNDLLYGDAGADDVYGDEGNDTLVDGADRDNLYGGAGNDTYILASGLGVATTLGPDMIYEDINGGGLDIIKILGSGSDIRIWVDASEDLHIRFLANPNDEYVVNGEAVATGGTDVVSRIERIVYNNGQLDTSYSLNLFDTDDGHVIHGSAGGDTIDGLGGNDVIYGFDGSDILVGSAGNDELRGGNGNDLLEAGADNDLLYGDAGNDTLYGHGGNDILAVSDGTDTLYGDIGSDTFWFNLLNTGIDTIADFKIAENDKIDISDILQGYNPLNHAISDFVEITTSGANSILKVDVNGGANSFVQIATINGVTGLTDEAALVASGKLVVV